MSRGWLTVATDSILYPGSWTHPRRLWRWEPATAPTAPEAYLARSTFTEFAVLGPALAARYALVALGVITCGVPGSARAGSSSSGSCSRSSSDYAGGRLGRAAFGPAKMVAQPVVDAGDNALVFHRSKNR